MNATPFVRDFGLMPERVAECGFDGVAKSIFMARLNVIHESIIEAAQKRAAKGS